MKKALLAVAILLLFTGCGNQWLLPEPNLPYRVWHSWEDMKEVLGDYLLFPTYLPEVTEQSRYVFKTSDFSRRPRRPWRFGEVYIQYEVHIQYFDTYLENRMSDSMYIAAFNVNRTNIDTSILLSSEFHERFLHDSRKFNEHTITIGGIDIAFFSVYGTFGRYLRNARIVHYTFKIDNVLYVMSWT